MFNGIIKIINLRSNKFLEIGAITSPFQPACRKAGWGLLSKNLF